MSSLRFGDRLHHSMDPIDVDRYEAQHHALRWNTGAGLEGTIILPRPVEIHEGLGAPLQIILVGTNSLMVQSDFELVSTRAGPVPSFVVTEAKTTRLAT